MVFKRGDIVRMNTPRMGGNLQDGIRPAIVISNNIGNEYSNIITVVPMTAILKKLGQPTHVFIKGNGVGLRYDSVAMCEQITTISKFDVDFKLGRLEDDLLKKLDNAIKVALNV